jgi:hypothetical protein
VSVVRFLGPTARDEATQGLVLGSFADHPDREERRYRIFDLDLRLPAACLLDGHSFAPGHFRLTFRVRGPGSPRLAVHRLGPADALLAGRSPADWAVRLAAELVGGGTGWAGSDPGPGQGIELHRRSRAWPGGPGRPGSLGWLSRLLPGLPPGRTSHAVVRLWRVEEKNRLLAVVAGSGAAIETGLFESVCAGVRLA